MLQEQLVECFRAIPKALIAIWKRLRPSSFDFLTLHYMFIVGMTLFGSLIVRCPIDILQTLIFQIFAGGHIRYIDALFLASSSCTQAGLATRNLNELNTWQQVCFFLLASTTNPIVIHSATAFVRLYWFQRRFAHIVEETNARLHMRKSKSRGVNSMDLEERGVGGREIRVLFNEGRAQPADHDHDANTKDPASPGRVRRKSSVGFSERISMSEIMPRKKTSTLDDASNPLINGVEPAVQSSTSSSERMIMEKTESEEAIQFGEDCDDDPATNDIPGEKLTRRATGDIRFAALPVPRKEGTTDGGQLNSSFNNGAQPADALNPETSSRSVGTMLLEIGQRTMTLDGAVSNRIHRRRPSTNSRFGGRSTTLDRTLSTALRRRRNSSPASRTARSEVALPYISFQPTIGRNSAFMSLTKEQRAELGGIEYRATKTLCWVLVVYYFGFHLLGFICYISFIYTAQTYIPVINAIGVSRGWWSIFTSASAFNDLGLTLTPDSFISFQNAVFLLLVSSLLIVSGNTGFPCVLRFVIWVAHKLTPSDTPKHEEFAFLLDHPRRCFTLLFPSAATWWLLAILLLFNGIDLLLFIVLDLKDPVVSLIPVGYRIVDGLFQAFCTRTAGFAVVNLAGLHSAVLVSYLIMMYISVFPVAISIRRTNVYEERSLGIYSSEDDQESQSQSFVGTHIRRQLGFDLWYVFLALFIICIIENPVSFLARIHRLSKTNSR